MNHARLLPLAFILAACTSAPAETSSGTGGSAPDAGPPPDAGMPDAAPAATCPEGVPFDGSENKIVLDATVNGSTVKVVYDSGAPYSVFTTAVQAQLGAAPYTITLAGKSVDVGSSPSFVAALDLGIPEVVGIVGSDFAGKLAVTIDYPRSRLWVDDVRDDAALLACTHVEGMPALVDTQGPYYVYVQGSLEGTPGWFIVDTGASYGAVPDTVFDQLDAVHPRPALSGFYTPAEVGTFWARLASVGAMETGGKTVNRIVQRTIDDDLLSNPGSPPTDSQPLLGLLPHDYLANFLVTIDFKQKKLRLDAAKTATLTGATRFYVVGLGLQANATPPILVTDVLPGSSAADQGIAAGDELQKIAGQAIDAIDPYNRPWMLTSSKPGATIAVTVAHAGVPQDFMLDTRDLLTAP